MKIDSNTLFYIGIIMYLMSAVIEIDMYVLLLLFLAIIVAEKILCIDFSKVYNFFDVDINDFLWCIVLFMCCCGMQIYRHKDKFVINFKKTDPKFKIVFGDDQSKN